MDYFDWRNAGLNPGLSNRIISYRLKGGYFQSLSDLLKIYGFSDSLLMQTSVHLKIEKQKERSKKIDIKRSPKLKSDDSIIESNGKNINRKIHLLINSCDSTELQKIKGIGRIRASRIIRYRNKLGGFISKSQFGEVYGMDSMSLYNLNECSKIDSLKIKKISINKVDFKELLKHPYIDYSMCKIIINYRRQHGDFNSVKDFNNMYALDKGKISKLLPYLSFEE